MTTRIAVLASGGGSNLQSILEYLERLGDRRAGDVVLVASDREGAGALDRARARGIASALLRTARRPAGIGLADALREERVDCVALAGYLSLVPSDVVRAYAGRMINVHPALLPAFGGTGMHGLRVHQAVLAAGAAVSGVTVHLVDEVFDHGSVVAQWPVPVRRGDTAESLQARVLRVERALYPRVVNALAAGRVHAGSPIVGRDGEPGGARFILADRDDRDFEQDIDHALDI